MGDDGEKRKMGDGSVVLVGNWQEGREPGAGHTINEMNADYRSQITDCTRALTRLEGERPCSQRPITLNDSTLQSASSGVQEAVAKIKHIRRTL